MSQNDGSKTKKSTSEINPSELDSIDNSKICGIVMPIAAMGERYPEAHWNRVRLILQRAVERAGMRPQLVWDNPEVDVIQSAILQNLYENDVVICDVSNLNPNVMLETGLRLSTKKPTISVTDKEIRPPFDISTIGYIDYQRDLEFNAIESFIKKLSRKIEEVSKADNEGRYHSYVEQFRFETVQPSSVTVSSDDYIKERLDDLTTIVRQLARGQQQSATVNPPKTSRTWKTLLTETAEMEQNQADNIENSIDEIAGMICHVEKLNENYFRFIIRGMTSYEKEFPNITSYAKNLIETARMEYIPF